MKNIVGSIVEKENFFGREKEISRAWELLNDGNSLTLAAPRRVGKSSFAKKMLEIANANGWSCVDITVEGIRTEFDFFNLLGSQIADKKWYESLKNRLKELKISVKDIGIEWESEKSQIYLDIENKLDHRKDTLIFIDELTIFLNNLRKDKNGLDDVENFLEWLRRQRFIQGSKIRWIFCNSIGIENFTSKHKLSKYINTLTDFKLDELKGEEPVLFIKELAKSKKIDFPDDVIQGMLDKLNWNLPYFIQVLFKEIIDLYEIDGEKISIETVGKAYNNLINSTYFNTWDERLSDFPDDEKYTRLILDELSKSKNGVSRNVLQGLIFKRINDEDKTNKILTQLLTRLKNDGYITMNEKKHAFRSPLLRDFWYNRFVL
ncbi:MAG: ATP-binding protein [Tannerella sp.]|jgi:hypothetical protein|nr:ATP-binding protein [Tannerella sp.]